MAARRLSRRQARRESGRFLAEGAQAVRSALRAGAVLELFATPAALARNADLLTDVDVSQVSEKDVAALSDTVTPQGLVAVCRRVDVPIGDALRGARLVAVLVEPNDPGNAGTILRTADAAGADAVVLAGGVDVYNGKCVRATAGSLFHLDVVIDVQVADVLRAASEAGLRVLATTGAAPDSISGGSFSGGSFSGGSISGGSIVDSSVALDSMADLQRPTAWLFGTEAHGLPDHVLACADQRVRVPIYGRAESLNLAAAAAVCLYASARAQRAG